MLGRVRGPESTMKLAGHYDHGPSAKALAEAIARHATSREEAALAAVYVAYESGADANAVGDKGKCHGAYQLRYVPPDVAADPDASTRIWLSLARDAQEKCDGEMDERMARLMSGSCGAGRMKARKRAAMAHEIARVN